MKKILYLSLIILVYSINGFSQKNTEVYCSIFPETPLFLSEHKADYESHISPFDENRDYFIYISKFEYAKNGYIEKWCVYNTNENKIIVIDSALKSNYEKIYFGFDNDSLFGFDNNERRYFKIIFPQRTISYIIDSNKIRVFEKVRNLKIIENKLEYKINKRYDLVYNDSRKQKIVIYTSKGNYRDSILFKNAGGAKFESNIHWYSDTELLFVKGRIFESRDFLDDIYIYNIKNKKTQKLSLKSELLNFWDYKDSVFVLCTANGLTEAKLVIKDGIYKIEEYKSINWDDFQKEVSGLYAFFRVKNNSYIYKAETPRYNFVYSKLGICK